MDGHAARIRSLLAELGDELAAVSEAHDVGPPPTGPERVLSLAEVAEYLGISRSSVQRLRRRGAIHGIAIGRRWVVAESELRRFQAAGGER